MPPRGAAIRVVLIRQAATLLARDVRRDDRMGLRGIVRKRQRADIYSRRNKFTGGALNLSL